MKTTYLLQDGGTITATCAADFRYFDQTGNTVRADSPDHFLNDLLESGYTRVKE